MKSKAKVISLTLSLILSAASISGCSGGNKAPESSEDISNTSVVESASEESSEQSTESSEESYETVESSSSASEESSSSKPGIDPAVEERSYSDEEKQKEQDTRIPNYKYRPLNETYVYRGTESKVIIPPEFTICPGIVGDNVKTVIVPETITKIPKGAFTGCSNLEKLVILNPDCEVEDGRILPEEDPDFYAKYHYHKSHNNKLINIYCYFRSDKTVPKQRVYNIGGCSKVFNALGGSYIGKNFDEYMHDLAEESYE